MRGSAAGRRGAMVSGLTGSCNELELDAALCVNYH